MSNSTINYAEYVHYISLDSCYYGPDFSELLAYDIFATLRQMVMSKFPGIAVLVYRDGAGSCKTTGPDNAVCDEINQWMNDHWTDAL